MEGHKVKDSSFRHIFLLSTFVSVMEADYFFPNLEICNSGLTVVSGHVIFQSDCKLT